MTTTRRSFFGKLATFLGAGALIGKEALKAEEPIVVNATKPLPQHLLPMQPGKILIDRTATTSTYTTGTFNDGTQWIIREHDGPIEVNVFNMTTNKYQPLFEEQPQFHSKWKNMYNEGV